MKFLNLIRCEFIKNYTLKKVLGVFLILIFSVVAFTWFTEMVFQKNESDLNDLLSHYQIELKVQKESSIYDDLEKEFYLYIYQQQIDYLKMLIDFEDTHNVKIASWQQKLSNEILKMDAQEFVIDKALEGKTIPLSILNSEYLAFSFQEMFSNLSESDLLKRKEEIRKERMRCLELIEENLFYKYIEYQLELVELEENGSILVLDRDYQFSEFTIPLFKEIVKRKIASEDNYYVHNIYQRITIGISSYDSIAAKNLVDQYVEEAWAILEYSIQHGKKQDIVYNSTVSSDADYIYITTKTITNGILDLSIVVLILAILTSGDIISNEHAKGTEKLLFTSSNKRWKILLSKFIYMILNMYIIWFLAFLFLMIYAGMKYGYQDLFTSKLIYRGGSVIEVNYILYMIQKIFYVSIPVVAMLSITFMISTISLNTAVTIGISILFSVLSPFLWHFIQQYRILFLAYTPFPYAMFSQVIYLNENFVKTVSLTPIKEITGISISCLTIVICYTLSNIIYIKRDIKN